MTGLAGGVYLASVIIGTHRQTNYKPVLEDYIFHLVTPIISYAMLLIAGAMAFRHLEGALYTVAVAALVLLYTGIHNAWDAAIYLAMKRKAK